MSDSEDGRFARIRGIKTLLHDAVELTVDRVEDGHASAARGAERIVEQISPELAPIAGSVWRAIVAIPLASVRAVNRIVEKTTEGAVMSALGPWIDAPLEPIAMRSDITRSAAWIADALIGAINGASGDYLHRERNPLDLGFTLRGDASRGRVAVFVHGLFATEWSWCWNAAVYHGDAGESFATLLARDHGFASIFARYNSGRRVEENGRLLAEALEARFETLPDELVLIGHSMGGLVVRSACRFARDHGHRWVSRVSKVFTLGTPHRGAPLEGLAHVATEALGAVDHPATKVLFELAKRRSEGIRDLREGVFGEELVEGIAYYFVSATVTEDPAHPLGWIFGDALVRVESASGPIGSERFEIETSCFGGVAHHELQNLPSVYAWLSRAIGAGRA